MGRAEAGAASKRIGRDWERTIVAEAYEMFVAGLGHINHVSPASEMVRGRDGTLRREIDDFSAPDQRVVEKGVVDFFGTIGGKPVVFDAKTVQLKRTFKVQKSDEHQLDQLARFYNLGWTAGYYVGFWDGVIRERVFFSVHQVYEFNAVSIEDGLIVSSVSGIGGWNG